MSETTPEAEPRKLAEEARDRVRFEEEALGLADQVYRVARRLVSTREEAEDLMQETYARAFRSWQSYQPGTNLRAWLLRILTNLNIDRGRRQQRAPQTTSIDEHGDYYLYDKLEARVLMMLSEGLLNKQIAYNLSVSEATVKAHVSAILQKLGVESRTQAVIAAAKIESGQWPQPAA